MTGWNLPPGVNVSDIPGNRPIDIFIENYCDKKCSSRDEKGNCPCNDNVEECPEHVVEQFYDRN